MKNMLSFPPRIVVRGNLRRESILILFLVLLLPLAAAAEGCGPPGIYIPCSPAGGPSGNLSATGLILSFIDILLLISGILAVLFIIIGGIRYIIAHGNEEQAESAKKTILHAIIGLVVVILAFVIVRVISNALILGSFGT